MPNRNKNKGSAYERDVVNALRDAGFRVDRTRAGWTDDRGDVHGLQGPHGEPFVIECKNHKAMDLAGWMAELERECANALAVHGAVVHKKRGTTSVDDHYATLPFGMLVSLLKQAGYH